MDSVPSRDMTMVIGDFNAKVEITTHDEQYRNIVGKYGLDERNLRGDNLIQFYMGDNLTIANTIFEHHPKRRGPTPMAFIKIKLTSS